MDAEAVYTLAGPFTVEVTGDPFAAHFRLWLTSDEAKRIRFEGNARELEEYIHACCEPP